MNEYPDWVELLRYLGLDPITVWVEYRTTLFIALALTAILLIAAIYWSALQLRGLIANYKHAFATKMSFHRSIREVEEKMREPVLKALDGEPLVYAIPAIAQEDVQGFRKSVGYIILTKTKLIFTAAGQKIDFALGSFEDANVRDGNKHMELKLIFEKSKPVFHLLGISRDHAQELFMKMHAFRVAIKDSSEQPREQPSAQPNEPLEN
jgi:hypothetical protein